MSKTQSIFDKVKTPSNLASVTNNQKCDQSKILTHLAYIDNVKKTCYIKQQSHSLPI